MYLVNVCKIGVVVAVGTVGVIVAVVIAVILVVLILVEEIVVLVISVCAIDGVLVRGSQMALSNLVRTAMDMIFFICH